MLNNNEKWVIRDLHDDSYLKWVKLGGASCWSIKNPTLYSTQEEAICEANLFLRLCKENKNLRVEKYDPYKFPPHVVYLSN